jgi:hypothetical protein
MGLRQHAAALRTVELRYRGHRGRRPARHSFGHRHLSQPNVDMRRRRERRGIRTPDGCVSRPFVERGVAATTSTFAVAASILESPYASGSRSTVMSGNVLPTVPTRAVCPRTRVETLRCDQSLPRMEAARVGSGWQGSPLREDARNVRRVHKAARGSARAFLHCRVDSLLNRS